MRRQGRRAERRGPRALRLRARRGVRGRRRPLRPTRSCRTGCAADFAITGEPTDLHIGVQAKGVLAVRVEVGGIAAHGSTPWLGDNAILKAHDAFRRIETLPLQPRVLRPLRPPVDQPRAHRRRRRLQQGARPLHDGRRHPLPAQPGPRRDPRRRSARSPDVEIVKSFTRAPAVVSRTNPYVRALREAVCRSIEGEALSVGRDGASDAISFLEAGIPAVEFGPIGGGHHGPEEWVSIESLTRYRQALGDFVTDAAGLAGARSGRRRRAAAAALRRRRPGVVSVWEGEQRVRRAGLRACAQALRARRGAHRAAGGDGGRQRRCCCRSRDDRGLPEGVRRRSPAIKNDARQGRRPAIRRRSSCSAPTGATATGKGDAGALGHDDARAPGPRQERDGGHVDPARPQGRDPGPRDRQDQRGLRASAARG